MIDELNPLDLILDELLSNSFALTIRTSKQLLPITQLFLRLIGNLSELMFHDNDRQR